MVPSHTLVTFIGRTRTDPETGQKGYKTASYKFPRRSEPVVTGSFGLALSNQIDPKPSAVVVLGTDGSDWGVLVEKLAKGDEEEDSRIELLEAESKGAVTQAMLDAVTPIIARGFGTTVVPRLIPVGQTDDEQIEILEVIADSVGVGDVSIDVTHGLRYFGMIGFVSARMLERLRDAIDVREIWYGALDLTKDGLTPVLQLKGLSRVQSWVGALERFDATGDYGVFAPLLIEDGVREDKVRCLERAAFHERNLNLGSAARQLRTFLPVLNGHLPGASGLFRTRLLERLRWRESSGLGDRQKKLAREHLRRRDYLRASILGLEALVTLECNRQGLPEDIDHRCRKSVLNRIADEERHLQHEVTPFRLLRKIRNALAHADPPSDPRYADVLANEDRLRREIHRAIDQLLR